MSFSLVKLMFPSREIVGIDIGSYAVKIVCFAEDKKKIRLKDWGYIPLSIKSETPPEEKKAIISQEIRNYLKKKGIQAKYAATSISGNAVIVRYVKLPKLARKELALTLNVEAEPFIPFDIKDVNLTYFVLNDVMEEGQPKMETVLVAAKKDAVMDKIDILSDAGLDPLIIDVDSFALETLCGQLFPQPDANAALILNIGHKVTNLSIVCQGGTRVVRDIFIAGVTFEKAVQKALKTDAPGAGAEALKRSRGLLVSDEDKEAAIAAFDKEGVAVSKAAAGVLKDLHTEVSRSIDFYLSQGVDLSISRIMLSGGIANLGNIAKFMSGEFKVPVEVVNPFSFLPDGGNIPKEVLPSLAVAAGLALRKLKDWE
jgi:type IV pilus assembly protein PilM